MQIDYSIFVKGVNKFVFGKMLANINNLGMKDISKIIARTLLKVADDDEREELSRWKGIKKENERFLNNFQTFMEMPQNIDSEVSENNRERLLYRMNRNNKLPKSARSISFIQKIAAILVFSILFAGLGIYFGRKIGFFNVHQTLVVSTEAGQQSQVTLPDGSLVWLNANTSVEYSNDLRNRKVILNGEAYFEIEHNALHPFLVDVNNVEIKVLGTKFNASHYPNSNTTEAALFSGSITMTLPDKKEIEVFPGQKIAYNEEKNSYTKRMVDIEKEITWRDGILVFENVLFEDLLYKLERYYDVRFIYDNSIVKDIHYSGTVDNLSINKVLEFINLTITMNYEINNKTIYLKSLDYKTK